MSILVLTSDTLIGTAATGNIEYNGQFFGTDSNASRAQMQRITQGTAVASTSGTSIDFTGLPAWVKRLTVMFAGVSTSGTSHILVQLGAGSVTSTGYISTAQYNAAATVGNTSSTAGYIVWNDVATFTFSGSMKIQTLGSNIWVSDHTFKVATNQTGFGGGDITLGGTLDRLRITTVSGTPTFDAGSVNILIEG